MKYQDLCIKISEVLRAKGINTVYFEDVNLLNSEDVVYPAAVVQLVRVEQERDSDRYTIMLTVCGAHNNGAKKDDGEFSLIPLPLDVDYGFFYRTGLGLAYNDTYSDFGISKILPRGVQLYSRRMVQIAWLDMTYNTIRPKLFSSDERLFIDDIIPQNTPKTYMQKNAFLRVQTFMDGNDIHDIYLYRRNEDCYEIDINTKNIRGITEILSEDERIQINSCVTTPFKWKFRDEVEGVTAEINLSLFFDSRCN